MIRRSVQRVVANPAVARWLGLEKRLRFVSAAPHRSDSDNGRYIAVVEAMSGDDKQFQEFKQNQDYRRVLEHLSEDDGNQYRIAIKEHYPEIYGRIQCVKRNDWIGSPDLYDYAEVGRISPTTLRYTKVAADLEGFFGSMTEYQIVEIGIGYGGQLLVLDSLSDWRSYLLLDLPPVLRLTEKYLESHILRNSYCLSTLNRTARSAQFDLAVSNYAFSELPRSLQHIYIEKILSKAKRGYLTMNSGRDLNARRSQGKLTAQEICDLLPSSCEMFEAHPWRSPWRYIIVWGHSNAPGWADSCRILLDSEPRT